MRFSTRFPLLLTAVLLLTFGLVSCDDDSTSPSTTGTVRISLVDAPSPLPGLEAITLVLGGVRVHAGEDAEGTTAGWIDVMPDTLTVEERTFDLLQLVDGVEAVLGEVSLPAGLYTQIRLLLEEASITVDGTTHELTIPSGMQSGLKLIHPFEVTPDEISALTLDFDAARSVIETPPGSQDYKLKPTIRVVQTVLSGSISGTVTPLDIGAMVLAIAPDTGDTVTTTQVAPLTGGYVLQALLAGSYHVMASAPGYETAVDSNVTVQAGMETTGVDFELVPLPE